jgi:AcrR family transcriptional regulator
MTKRDEIKKIKKSEIHKSALELFSKNGYFQTSIADIVKKSNISKGLFYHYYCSKAELFEGVVIESFESLLNYFPNNKEQEFNDDNLAYFTNNVIIPSLDNDKTQWKLLNLLFSQQILYEIALKYLAKSTTYNEYEKILQRYFKAKGYEKPDVEVKLFTSSLIGICIQYIINPSDFPVKDVMGQFTSRIISKS